MGDVSLRNIELKNAIKTMIAIAADIANDGDHTEQERRGARMVSVSQRAYLKQISVDIGGNE